jgi:predicted lipid-binding transport protein (Tim44 family)
VSPRPILKSLIAAAVLFGLAAMPADARRGGSFGSRGTRTYSAPNSTGLTPGYVAPVRRSMTDRSVTPQYAPSYQPGFNAQRRPGIFGGFGGGLLTGIVAGGLIGHFFGHGYGYGMGGGGGGFLAILIQLAILGGVIWLVMRLFAGRSSSSPSYSAAPSYQPDYAPQPVYGAAPPQNALQISDTDQETFERLLGQLQDAFGREDYGALRAITTPEVMGYLAEELSDNATHGRRNEVTGTRLLDGEVSEAWSEDGRDYATVAMRYESTDVTRDRATGAILSGSTVPSQTTELWTFVRASGDWGGWKVSAIQES